MYDLPSISEFNRGRTASFSYSETDSIEYKDISNEYEKWWNSNTAFDLILDWEKIQNAINDFRGMNDRILSKCIVCQKDVLVPKIIITKKISIYCPEHNPNYNRGN